VFEELLADKVVVAPEQIVGGLLSVKVGIGFTVISNDPIQPFEDVKLIVALPGETAVTIPEAFTCTIDVFELDQGFPSAGSWLFDIESCCVAFAHICGLPAIIGFGLFMPIV
jgi:hypothetical protein